MHEGFIFLIIFESIFICYILIYILTSCCCFFNQKNQKLYDGRVYIFKNLCTYVCYGCMYIIIIISPIADFLKGKTTIQQADRHRLFFRTIIITRPWWIYYSCCLYTTSFGWRNVALFFFFLILNAKTH